MADRTGLAAVLDEAGARETETESSAEQLALLGMGIPASKRVAGRPAGRRNLRNQRVADLLLATVGDPLMELGRMAMLPVDHLAAALGISAADAFAEKRLCLAAVMPYVHQRQAIAVDVTSRNIVHLSIFDGPAETSAGGDDMGLTIAGTLAKIVTNQGAGDDGER